jgi:hypothetical protein
MECASGRTVVMLSVGGLRVVRLVHEMRGGLVRMLMFPFTWSCVFTGPFETVWALKSIQAKPVPRCQVTVVACGEVKRPECQDGLAYKRVHPGLKRYRILSFGSLALFNQLR